MNRNWLLSLILLAAPASAGPPAICWPVEIGNARSLPWEQGGLARDKTYRPARAVADTLKLLLPDATVLVRMETIRRAALYLQDRPYEREVLLNMLMSRVLAAELRGRSSAMAWFDAGYLAGCFEQMFEDGDRRGYLWVRKALTLSNGNPEIEYACSLLTLMGDKADRKRFAEHLEKCRRGATEGSLLAKNLVTLEKLYPPVLRYFKDLDQRKARTG